MSCIIQGNIWYEYFTKTTHLSSSFFSFDVAFLILEGKHMVTHEHDLNVLFNSAMAVPYMSRVPCFRDIYILLFMPTATAISQQKKAIIVGCQHNSKTHLKLLDNT